MLTFVISSYKQHEHELPLILHSLALQRDKRLRAIVVHDGGSEDALYSIHIAESFGRTGMFTAAHEGDYGHSPRQAGLQLVKTKYVAFSGADNYYTPSFVEMMVGKAEADNLDFVYCNELTNFGNINGKGELPYNVLDSSPVKCRIDIANFIVRADWAREIGFKDKSHMGDGAFVEELFRTYPVRSGKVEAALVVHN